MVIGPQTMTQLRQTVVHTDGNMVYHGQFANFVKGQVQADVNKFNLSGYSKHWLLGNLRNGTAVAVVGRSLLLNQWARENCKELVLAESINFGCV